MAGEKNARKGEKRKENWRKGKQREKLPPSVFINREDPFNSACLGLLYCSEQGKLQKKPKPKAITRDKMGRNQKIVTKRSQRQKAGKVNSGKMVNSAVG